MKKFLLATGMIAALAITSCKEEKSQETATTPDIQTEKTVPRSMNYQCGDTLVEFTLLADDKADMRIANVSYAMEQVVTASGAKYENLGNPDVYLWNKGDKATVSIKGEELPECIKTTATSEKKSDVDVWVLEDMNNAGIIDNSHLTLQFGADGRVSGSSGCNRYTGNYTREGNTLGIDKNMAVTRRACHAESLGQQENKFLETLSSMTSSTIDETGALILSNDAGGRLLFRKE